MVAISEFIIKVIEEKVLDKINNVNNYKNKYLTSNSVLLNFYYKYGTSLCFIISICIIYNMFTKDIIFCSDGNGNFDSQIRFALINFCLSYPQLANTGQFALFYKWVPWIMFLLSILMYTPRIAVVYSSCDYTANCLMKLNDDYDDDNDKKENLLEQFINTRKNKCKRLYLGCLFSHIYTLILNIFIFFLLDFLLQGRFLSYIPNTYPFERDALHFSDEISQRFYPFVDCTIKENFISLGRSEKLICHLTLMEYYEKIFFIIWLYLIVSSFFISVYIIVLFFLWFDNYKYFFNYLIIKKYLKFDVYLLARKKLKKKTNDENL